MTTDWQRLADYLRAELARLGWTQRDLAEHSGASERTINRLLAAEDRTYLPHSVPSIEQAIGWPPGTARRVLEGAEPPFLEARREGHALDTAAAHTERAVAARREDGEPDKLSVREALTLLELLRSAVSRLPVDARSRAILAASADDLEWKIERAVAAERDNPGA